MLSVKPIVFKVEGSLVLASKKMAELSEAVGQAASAVSAARISNGAVTFSSPAASPAWTEAKISLLFQKESGL